MALTMRSRWQGRGTSSATTRIENFLGWNVPSIREAAFSFPGKPGGPHANIDFYNNYYCNIYDNPVEVDTGTHNIRFMRNLCLNSDMLPERHSPIYGGPAYFIRNIVYHAPDRGAIKMYDRPAGRDYVSTTQFCAEVYAGQPSANLNGREALRTCISATTSCWEKARFDEELSYQQGFLGVFTYMDTYNFLYNL